MTRLLCEAGMLDLTPLIGQTRVDICLCDACLAVLPGVQQSLVAACTGPEPVVDGSGG